MSEKSPKIVLKQENLLSFYPSWKDAICVHNLSTLEIWRITEEEHWFQTLQQIAISNSHLQMQI